MFSKLMKLSHKRGFIDRESFVAQYLALAIFTIGVASTIGVDDLLAAFAAGCAISWDGHFNVQTADDSFSSVIDYVLNCACFIYIGAWLPFELYNSPALGISPWRLVVLMLAILALRRIPPLLLLYRWVPEITSWKEALFSGHFGPMGVSAIFVSALARTRLPTPANPPADQAQFLAATIQPIVSFIVLGSIIVHGLSIPFFNLGREVHSRTVTLTYTWTRTRTGATLPDWVFYARRSEGNTIAPAAAATDVDVECGIVVPIETNGKADTLPESESNEARDRSPSPANDVTSVVEEVAISVSSKGTGSGSTDEPTKPATLQVAEGNPDDAPVGETSVQNKLVRFPSAQ